MRTVKAMAGKRRRFKPYELFGRTVNLPDAVARLKGDTASCPGTCASRSTPSRTSRSSSTRGHSSRSARTKPIWPCRHPGTDIPLGSLADEVTQKARKEAHAAFDPLWRGKTPWHRAQAYKALARAMGVRSAHISWFDADECRRVVRLCQCGGLMV